MEKQQIVDEYLKATGQTWQELFAGAWAYGMDFIVSDLIPKAMDKNKKIVFHDQFEIGIDAMSYSFEDL